MFKFLLDVHKCYTIRGGSRQ